MKPFRRMAALAMAALLVVALLSGSALAEGAQGSAAPALKAGRWYSPGNAARLLTVKVSKDALLTASWKGNSQERLYIDLYKDAERKHFLTGLLPCPNRQNFSPGDISSLHADLLLPPSRGHGRPQMT